MINKLTQFNTSMVNIEIANEWYKRGLENQNILNYGEPPLFPLFIFLFTFECESLKSVLFLLFVRCDIGLIKN